MPKHAVVDGSNIATEGQSEPSLAQLRDAVTAFGDEYDFDIITVIVDASFEHRVAKSETKAARAAIDANEMITPPAGVIGRGDTFILQVADRANAVVLSNDSFQEFHGTFSWLFDEGRLIGGKPIPGVGWVYVPRAPVRGPVSRRAQANAKDDAPKAEKAPTKRASKKAAKATRAAKKTAKKAAKKATKRAAKAAAPREQRTETEAAAPAGNGSNAANAWKSFQGRHPVGSKVKATVEEFSSHGAYARAKDVAIYLPLRLLGNPAPRRARDVVAVGESRQFVIHRYDEERNGIDAGIIAAPRQATKKSAKKATVKKTAAKKAAKKAPAKKTAKKAPPKKTAPKRSAKKAPAKKTAQKTAQKTAKKAPAKKTAQKTATRRRR